VVLKAITDLGVLLEFCERCTDASDGTDPWILWTIVGDMVAIDEAFDDLGPAAKPAGAASIITASTSFAALFGSAGDKARLAIAR
jgi:hypothetical protein